MALFSKAPSIPPESSSRQDARIAVLMRAEGYNRETVNDAIRRCAPELRKDEKRAWRRYAARAAAYAFGIAGDMELANIPRPEEQQEQKIAEVPPLPKLPEPPVEEMRYEAPRLRFR